MAKPPASNFIGRAVEISGAGLELQEFEEAQIFLLREDPSRLVLRMVGSATTVNFLMSPASLALLGENFSIDAELILQGKMRRNQP